MMKLLEIYYNINYYCTYKLLFILCWRMLNPLYWLSLLKWDNRYIKWLVSIGKKTENTKGTISAYYFGKRHHFLFIARSLHDMRILYQ